MEDTSFSCIRNDFSSKCCLRILLMHSFLFRSRIQKVHVTCVFVPSSVTLFWKQYGEVIA